MGRRKIEIKLVKDTNIRQVTFSKRRSGLFKKANELSILCDCKLAIVMFSPGNKPYSYGHPDVDTVAAKFLQQGPNSNGDQCSSSSNDVNLNKMNKQLAVVLDQSNEEAKKAKVLDKALHKRKNQLKKLQDLCDLQAQLQCNIKSRIDELEAAEAMLMIKEQPVCFSGNHVAKRKSRKKN